MSGPLSGTTVAVVGGGLAGLAAALECCDLGAQVTLVERRRRLGGLTWSFDHNGLQMDNGQHVYLACCDSYLSFLRRIGAQGDVEPARPLDVPVVSPSPSAGGRPVSARLRRSNLPAPLHLAGSLLRYPYIGVSERLSLGRALVGLHRLDLEDPALDRVTFGEWLTSRGQSLRCIAALWDLITVPTVNLPAAEASLAAAAMVFKTGLLSRPDAADIGWSAVPLGRLHGERAGAALERAGASVLTGVRVLAIRRSAAPGWEVVTEGGPLAADAVVAAVPHEEASSILPEASAPSQGRWAELGSSAIADVHLVLDRRVTNRRFMAALGSPVQWVFDRSAAAGLEGPGQYLAVSLSAADRLLGLRPEALVGTTLEALGRLLPAVASARLVDSAITKERRATFRAAPGSSAIRPPARSAHPGLVLAGAWTATGWPATMEGAVRSGVSAARSLAAHTPISPGSPATLSDSPQIPQEVA